VAAEVVWGARHEMARTVEDILARRTRALFLNARAAIDVAPCVADLLAVELGRVAAWKAAEIESFLKTAANYVVSAE
jgi:glycerol-3-phosphate dehydrogenase